MRIVNEFRGWRGGVSFEKEIVDYATDQKKYLP